MYLSHFGLDEPPFRITSNTDFFFEGANRGATLEGLLYAITHDEGIVKVLGEVGSGKTMLCRVLIDRLPGNVETIFLANPSLSREEILRAIAEDLRLDLKEGRTTLLLRALQEHLIQRYAEGGRVILLIDEAHAMPSESLEEIRLLSNLESNRHKLLQIVLFGQPELDVHLDRPHMRQLKERITHSFKLRPLLQADIENYVDFRMRTAGYRGTDAFSKSAVRLIATASEGLTRRVNILCDKSLLAAFADDKYAVQLKHVRAAVKDAEFRRDSRPVGKWWLVAGGLAAGLIIGIASRMMPSFFGPPAGPVEPFHTESPASATTALLTDSAPAMATDNAARESISDRPASDQATQKNATAGSTTVQQSIPNLRSKGSADIANSTSHGTDRGALASAPQNGTARWEGQSKFAAARIAATNTWLAQTPADRYSIQLLTAVDADTAWIETLLGSRADFPLLIPMDRVSQQCGS